MQKFILSVLFLLIIAAVPSAAFAAKATIQLLPLSGSTPLNVCSGNVTSGTTCEYLSTRASSNPFPLAPSSDPTPPLGCIPLGSCFYGDAACIAGDLSHAQYCFEVGSTSQAHFTTTTGGLGQLILENLYVRNWGTQPARFRVLYQQFNSQTNTANVQCTGMSLDGWFSTPGLADTLAPATGAVVALTMSVTYTTNSGGTTTQQIDGSFQGSCDPTGLSATNITDPTPGQLTYPNPFSSGITDSSLNYYNPQNPQQIIQQLPSCNNCVLGATIQKRYTTLLQPGYANNSVGTPLGVICEVVPASGKKPKPSDFDQCAGQVAGKFISKEATMTINNSTLKAGDSGTVLVDLHDGDHFNVRSVSTDPNTGLPLCTLFADYSAQGVMTDHAVTLDTNGDGVVDDLRMQFENSGLGITTATKFLRLECQADIGGTGQTIATAVEVKVKNN